METVKQFTKLKNIGLLTLLSGILVGIPLTPTKTQAQTVVTCPGLYYEEPWRDIIEPPYGCPPNQQEVVNELNDQGVYDQAQGVYTDNEYDAFEENDRYQEETLTEDPNIYVVPPNTRVVPPLPEVRSNIITSIEPYNGQVEVILDNDTNATIRYQVLGHTGQRWLEGGDQAILRNIPVPVTITMVREDGGLIKAIPMPEDNMAESNNLRVILEEDLQFDSTMGVLRIQPDGNVLLN